MKHLVELHGGQVEAKSPGEGKGATFIVRLPIAIVQEIVPGREHFLGNERGSNEPWDDVKLTNIRVLVVDEFIRRVRAQGVRIPAVAATAFARFEDRIRALQAGYNMHLAKPLESNSSP